MRPVFTGRLRRIDLAKVAFAAGLYGHGFKFTSVLGEILTDWTLDGATRHPVEFLSPERPGLRGAGAAPRA